MIDLSEQGIKKDCPHCDPKSFALEHPLKETERFWVVCDVHPLIEGHILIIPKRHLSCIGEFDEETFREFEELYSIFCRFIKDKYNSVSTFEHGKIGQTVFHSHVHILPFDGKADEIVAEGSQNLNEISDITHLKDEYVNDGKYLFFSIIDKMWTVNLRLGEPRFFRDRFASAIGKPERGNWKNMHSDKRIMDQAVKEIESLEKKWKVDQDRWVSQGMLII